MRLGRHNMFMEIARIVARRGTCPRLCVGAVVVIDNRVVSIGYNGSIAGQPHCTEIGCLMAGGTACIRTVHAEVNAIEYIPYSLSDSLADLYVTHSPCNECAEAIIKSNVEQVFFEASYRDAKPVAKLMDNNIKVYRIMPNGYLIRGSDGKIIEIS